MHHLEEKLHRVERMAQEALELSNHNSRRITAMAQTIEDLKAKEAQNLADIDTFTNTIASDLVQVATVLRGFQAQIAAGTLTADQLSPIIDGVTARAEALHAVASSADQLVPPAPPPVVVNNPTTPADGTGTTNSTAGTTTAIGSSQPTNADGTAVVAPAENPQQVKPVAGQAQSTAVDPNMVKA